MRWRNLALAIVLSSAGLPARAQSDFKFTKADFKLLELSDQRDDYFARQGMVYEDDATTKYVGSVGRSVLPPGDPPEHVMWRFYVLRDPIPNAFALANGSIYIDSGLLSLMQNEAQLASVLGHEETHVLNRHAYLEYRSARKKQVAANIFSIAGGDIIGTAASAMLAASQDGYSREHEQEADMRGLQAMEQAGYDPAQMPETFRLLEKSEGPDSSHALYRDHPRLDARIKYLTAEISAHPPPNTSARVNTDVYSDATEAVCRHDLELEIAALRPRRAVAIALHLTDRYPTPDHYVLLGDAYKAMGGRPFDASDDQLKDERKQQKKMLSKMTPQEYEKALRDAPDGKNAWSDNRKEAEEAYGQAIHLDDSNGPAHRDLAMMYEDSDRSSDAIAEYQKYLQVLPNAWDHDQIQKRIDTLQSAPLSSPAPPAGAVRGSGPGRAQP